jgi:hydrogenase-4 component F
MPAILPAVLVAIPLVAALLCLIPASSDLAEWAGVLSAPLLLGVSVAVAVLGGPAHGTCAGGTAAHVCGGSAGVFGLYVDALSALLVLVIGLVAAVATLYSRGYMRAEVAAGHLPAATLRWYYLWLQLFVASMLVAVLASNLGVLWVAMEVTTVLSGVLVGISRRPHALEAAWKYVVICSLGIALALFGTVLMYYAATPLLGHGNAALDWATLATVAPHLNPALVRLSFAFVLIGFGTKAGLAPMHTWLPDAHSQAPSPISAILSAALLNCALYAILRFHALAVRALGPDFSAHLLLAFGLISVAIAIPFILIQHDVKRLLAYSSVEHIGIVATAVGVGGRLALFAALLHLLNHALTKCGMFLATGTVIQRLRTRNISRLGGVARAAPSLAVLLLLGGLALAGSPPFGPFLSEFTAVRAAMGRGIGLLGALLLALLAVAFGAMLFQLGHIALGPASHRGNKAAARTLELRRPAALLNLAPLALPAGAVLLLGLHVPDGLVTLLQQAGTVVGG